MSKDLPVICAAVIKDNKGRVLLGKRVKDFYSDYWAFPGGHIKFGEKIEQALRREIREETGLKIKSFNLKKVSEIHIPKDKFHRIILYFDVKVKKGKLKSKSDIGNLRWFAKKEISKLKTFAWDRRALRV